MLGSKPIMKSLIIMLVAHLILSTMATTSNSNELDTKEIQVNISLYILIK